MLNPIEEREVSDSEYRFEGGEDEIVDQVNHEMALKRGEIKEIESDDEEEDEQEEDIGIGELRSLCEKVECLSLKYGGSETCLYLFQSLRQFWIQLRRVGGRRRWTCGSAAESHTRVTWYVTVNVTVTFCYTYLHWHKSNNASEIGPSRRYALWELLLYNSLAIMDI